MISTKGTRPGGAILHNSHNVTGGAVAMGANLARVCMVALEKIRTEGKAGEAGEEELVLFWRLVCRLCSGTAHWREQLYNSRVTEDEWKMLYAISALIMGPEAKGKIPDRMVGEISKAFKGY